MQLQQFCENLKSALLQDPKVERERISVTFSGFGDSSLNLVVSFHFHVEEFEDDTVAAQKYLHLIHQLVSQMRLDFAFPTRTLIMQNQT